MRSLSTAVGKSSYIIRTWLHGGDGSCAMAKYTAETDATIKRAFIFERRLGKIRISRKKCGINHTSEENYLSIRFKR